MAKKARKTTSKPTTTVAASVAKDAVTEPESSETAASETSTPRKKKKPKKQESMRETVEAVAVAFILAFLFRTFEAEAFVIPTGSMAPTLLGRHKDVDCVECGLHFRVGASEEVDPGNVPRGGGAARIFSSGALIRRLLTTRCPNCRFENDIENLPVFKGDRILVNKQLTEPKRFEVIVFKYPEEPQVNYIKRLVGLPGETIHIEGGDLFGRTDETEQWKILRKDDPYKQQAIQILVHNNDFVSQKLLEAGWPERWAPMSRRNTEGAIAGWVEDSANGWTPIPEERSQSFDSSAAPADETRWLRYRHIPPSQAAWAQALAGQPISPVEIRPRLVSDYCAYNTSTNTDSYHHIANDYGTFWVGDLTMTCQFEAAQCDADSELVLELVEGKRWFRCHIDLSTGQARLTVVNRVVDPENESEEILAEANCPVKGDGSWQLSFANVDNRLCLWVDGTLVDFGGASAYSAGRTNAPQQRDLTPVAIGVRGANAKVSNLMVHRDLYYRAETKTNFQGHVNELNSDNPNLERDLSERLDSPAAWFEMYSKHQNQRMAASPDRQANFKLGPDEFLVLGDNSPRSKDSRLFDINKRVARLDTGEFKRYAVPRSALIGKAFFVYWPHGIPFMNNGEGFVLTKHRNREGELTDYPDARVPFYPQVPRMRRIR